MKSDVDLYLSADRTKVTTEPENGGMLLVNAGREIHDAEIVAYGEGLLTQARALAKGEAEDEAPADAKAQEPAANKARMPAENK